MHSQRNDHFERMINTVVELYSSPSAVYCFAPDEHLSSKQQDDWSLYELLDKI
jgi:hypothetical protein